MTLQNLLRTELASRRRSHFSRTRRTKEQGMSAKGHAMGIRYAIQRGNFESAVSGLKNAKLVAKHNDALTPEAERKLDQLIGQLQMRDRYQAEQRLDRLIPLLESVREGVSDTIWKQISTGTKMSVGARNAVGGGNKIHFNVGRGKKNKIEVVYKPGQDLYTVNLWEFSRGMMDQKIVESQDGVYGDMLDDVIYKMVNK